MRSRNEKSLGRNHYEKIIMKGDNSMGLIKDLFSDKGDSLGEGAGLLSGVLGTVGSFTDDDQMAGDLAIASGSFGAASAVQGVGSSINKIAKADGASKKSSIFDGIMGIAGGLLGGGASIADIFSGGYQKSGNKEGQKRSGIASGALNTLGGLVGMGQGFKDLFGQKYDDSGKERETTWKDRVGAIGSILSSAAGFGGGIASIFSAADPENEKASSASKWLGLLGTGIGGAGSVFGKLFGD